MQSWECNANGNNKRIRAKHSKRDWNTYYLKVYKFKGENIYTILSSFTYIYVECLPDGINIGYEKFVFKVSNVWYQQINQYKHGCSIICIFVLIQQRNLWSSLNFSNLTGDKWQKKRHFFLLYKNIIKKFY